MLRSTAPTYSSRTSNSIQATNLTFFGDLQVGESSCLAPAITGVPVNQSITYGADAVFTVAATGTGLSYKWQEDRGSGFSNITDGGIYSNSATTALNLTKPPISANGYKYRCVITGTCGTATSDGNATLIVGKKALTITAGAKTKVYDCAIFPVLDYTVTYSGFLTGEDETDLSGTISFAGTAVTATNSGTYAITPAGLTSLNYDISFVSGTLNISKKALLITAVDKTKEYDGTVFPISNYTLSYSGFIAGDDKTDLDGTPGFTGTAIDAVNSGTYIITPGNQTAVNYDITYVSGSLNITKKSLIITAYNKSEIYGQANPALTVSYSGFVTGDNSSAIIGLFKSTTAFTGSPTGTYPIKLEGGFALNYSLSLVDGTLTVTKAALRASADDKVKVYGTDNPVLTISYSGFVNGDNAAVITEPSISTLCVTGSSAGTYPISLSGGSAANYTFTLVNGVMTVNKATATVVLGNLSTVYDGTGKTVTATTLPAGLTVNLTYNGSLISPVNAGTYAVVGAVSNNNYQGSASGNLVIGKAPQTITFIDIPSGLRMTQEHQMEASASSGLAVSFASSNSNVVSISGTVITVKGDGTITLTTSQSGNNNWLAAADVVQTVVTLPTFDNVSSLFTPNNDGMNDYWYIPRLEEYGTLQVTVYNRFGQAVYKSDDYKNDWDGTWNGNPLPSASYYYIMKSTLKGLSKGVVNIIK